MPSPLLTSRRDVKQSDFALRLFLVTVAVFGTAGGLAWLLITFAGRYAPPNGLVLQPAFWAGTVLLATGSWWLNRAVQFVRVEKQQPFRRCLRIGLAAGLLFVSVQSYGLYGLLRGYGEAAARETTRGIAFVFVALHAMHFLLALLFLVYVTLKADTDRYDHEYYWGVSACAMFWHFLGAVWLVLLMAFTIAR